MLKLNHPLRRWHLHRQQKKKNKETLQVLKTWTWLEKLFQSGMLAFDPKAHRLFITQPLASILLARGAEAWVNSIHNIYLYTHFLQTQQAWEDFFQKEEQAAVRKALSPSIQGKDTGRRDSGNGDRGGSLSRANQSSSFASDGIAESPTSLSRADIDRIRTARRMEITQSDMQPPGVEPFEFFIVPLTTEAAAEPIAVGYYDPDTTHMEVATWDEVSELVRANAK